MEWNGMRLDWRRVDVIRHENNMDMRKVNNDAGNIDRFCQAIVCLSVAGRIARYPLINGTHRIKRHFYGSPSSVVILDTISAEFP
jgi:hypothetical protein